MSSVNAIGVSQSTLLQQSSAAGRPSGPPPKGPPPEMQQALESAAEDAGLDSTQIADLLATLEETAKSAIDSGADPEAMRSALDSVLEDAGIDAEALHDQFAGMGMPNRGQGGPPQGAQAYGAAEGSLADATSSSQLLEMLRSLPIGSLYDSEV
ncbi:MAG: hypothetical protein ACF8R9_14385 [Phycisphaerales bacterium JB054]